MSRKEVRDNYRVVVYPKDPGDFGSIRCSGYERTEKETQQLCEQIAESIRRHVDDLPSGYGRGVSVVWDTKYQCSHCGWGWTEGDNSKHNGGCCGADTKVMEEAEAATLPVEP